MVPVALVVSGMRSELVCLKSIKLLFAALVRWGLRPLTLLVDTWILWKSAITRMLGHAVVALTQVEVLLVHRLRNTVLQVYGRWIVQLSLASTSISVEVCDFALELIVHSFTVRNIKVKRLLGLRKVEVEVLRQRFEIALVWQVLVYFSTREGW